MSTMRLLIVEDEKTLANLIKRGFEEEGYAVDVAYNGEDGLFFAENNNYDAIVLDIMLPIIDGISLLKKLREQNISTPIIILTAKDSVKDKVLGLDSGSDDYLTKPFLFEELLSRVRAIIRRKFAASSPIIKICDLEIDTAQKTVKRNNKKINLSAKEYTLLEYLALNKNKVISRTSIIEHLYDEYFDLDSNVIDVFINRIRNKIDKNFDKKLIHTFRGIGYSLKD
jgi:DNA-binding response OmpR family regulator